MSLPAGDFGFMTGLTVGRQQGQQQAVQWQNYAQGLNNQIAALSQQLREESAQRSAARATVGGLVDAINALPPTAKGAVIQALSQHFGSGFVRKARELGLPDAYAAEASNYMLHDLAGRLGCNR